MRSEPAASPCAASIASKASASALTCDRAVILGSVTTKFGGSAPPVSFSEPDDEEPRRPQGAIAQLGSRGS